VACVPCAIKFRFVDDPMPNLLQLASQLEERLLGKQHPTLSLERRIHGLIAAIVAAHEVEHLGVRQRGDLTDRANRLIADAVKQARPLLPTGTPVLVRMDSANWGRPSLWAAIRGGTKISVTVKMSSTIKTAISAIDEQACSTIKYTDARSLTRTPKSGSRRLRSPKPRSPFLPRWRSPSRSRAGW